MRYKIVSIVGARPQFIKLAPIYREFRNYKDIDHIVLHTGQHYDFLMSEVFFKYFKLPKPDINLSVGSGAHHSQTGEMIKKIGSKLEKIKPTIVIIYGDTNTTLAGALASVKLRIPIAHIESGLRSYIKYMPEEINRVVSDRLSDLLFVPSKTAIVNLEKEGISNVINTPERFRDSVAPYVIECGDLMYDILKAVLRNIKSDEHIVLDKYGLRKGDYVLATVHRAENTDNMENLSNIFSALNEIGKEYNVVLPIHPRTIKILRKIDGEKSYTNIIIIPPVSYNEMLIMEKNSRLILTDSGGVQKEAFWLGIPCITVRDRTEWIETVKAGFNFLTGANREKIIETFNRVIRDFSPNLRLKNIYGSGNSAKTVARYIWKYLKYR
ncbi:MAG: UDP-N-acetylglucosamine 2-epimerase (non-hydrolyzing) [Deltaproteobacteria bacterium]|nr:UDP-N-acetylglucosamine 2-epimerase (non-hydrolyzing) [Deltaproteobacteria bacterium]